MSRSLLLTIGVLFVGSGANPAADAPRPTPESVRATIQQIWSKDGGEGARAWQAVEAHPLALPVLRRELAADPNLSHRGDLERLIAKLIARQDKVNAERVDRWATEGRLDLLTEVRALTDGKAADLALTRLLDAGQELRLAAGAALGDRLARYPGGFLPRLPGPSRAAFDASKTTPAFDSDIVFAEKDMRSRVALFAERLEAPTEDLQESLLVGRAAIRLVPKSGRCELAGCLVYANTPPPLLEVTGSVIVVDGDLEFTRPTRISGSILVVNGDVTCGDAVPVCSLHMCVTWATGDIRLPVPTPPANSLFFAGGKVADAEKLATKGGAEGNVKEPPLPVRFLDPAEFGLTLEATKGGMKVAKVADKSAFAEAGLKGGDVIARVGEVDTATAPAFRRELRRGVVEGAVLLDVNRGKEKVELLVAVPDVPAAPKKDKDLKAGPPDKK
jgi:hypothetical protein